MFKTIKNALKTPEIRKRILYTLLLIVIFRFGCHITVPGVDGVALDIFRSKATNSISGLIDIISGGAFSKLSVFAMTITPYITASIVIQLLEAIGLYLTYSNAYKGYGVFVNPGFGTGAIFVLSLVAGTAFLMWLGEQITSKGIGNGISLIIFIGIISSLPTAISTLSRLIYTAGVGISTTGIITAIAIIIGALLLVAGVVFVQEAERRIPVQYAKKVVGRKMYGGQNTHIPLKLAMAGVMPVIFASSLLTFPAMIIPMFNSNIDTASGFWAGVYKFSMSTSSAQFGMGYTIANAIIYLLLIIAFTYFYTYATFNPAEVSNNIKKNGGFIPGIRAGKPTTEYLSSIMKKLTLFGGLFLSLIAILPMLLSFTNLNITFGGTSILIVVGVALETVQQLESRLVMRHYKGFLE